MSKIPNDLLYAASHEWIRITGDTGTVGITDHAQCELTDVVYVEPPKVGAKATAQSPIAVVESVKAASDIYSPVSGEVIEINPELTGEPALINTDPYGRAWIYRLKISNPEELKKLKDAAAYTAQLGES